MYYWAMAILGGIFCIISFSVLIITTLKYESVLPCPIKSIEGNLEHKHSSILLTQQGSASRYLAYAVKGGYVGPISALSTLPEGTPLQVDFCEGTPVHIISNGKEIFKLDQAEINEQRKTEMKLLLMIGLAAFGMFLFGVLKVRELKKRFS